MAAHEDHLRRITYLADRMHRRLAVAVSGIAFWTAIFVPFLYLLVMVRGVNTRSQFTTLVALIAVNYLALILGHSHHDRPER